MKDTAPDLRVLSYGGGTQSAALALMSAAGQLPRLDAVIMADTHGELPETYEYAEYVAGILDAAGVPFVTISAGSLEAALLAPARTMHNPTPPAHVLNPDGSKGRIGAYRCSYDYKRRIIGAEVKRRCGGRGKWKRARVEQWIGFSADELGRVKDAAECRCGHNRVRPDYKDGRPRGHRPGCTDCDCAAFDPWQVNRWPLIELGYRRADTIKWFAANGHPTPPRSACFFCPNSSNERLQLLKAEHPDLWKRACDLDAHIRTGGAFNARGNKPFAGRMFLHDSCTPLIDADLRTRAQREEDGGQLPMFDDAAISHSCDEGGVCFT